LHAIDSRNNVYLQDELTERNKELVSQNYFACVSDPDLAVKMQVARDGLGPDDAEMGFTARTGIQMIAWQEIPESPQLICGRGGTTSVFL
jgi:hypothetical protein